MKRVAALMMMVACTGGGMATGDDDGSGSGSGSGSGWGSGSGSGSGSGQSDHSKGWRVSAGDLALNYRSAVAGPLGNGTLNPVFTSNVTDSSVGTPVIDEAGNIYFVQSIPNQMPNLVSLSATGTMRWTKALAFAASDLVLGPNGDLFALQASGYNAGDQGHLYSFDTATGTQKSGSLSAEGLYHAVILKSGATFAQTYNQTAGYGLARFAQPTSASPDWTKPAGGDRTAISPQGDLVEVVVGAGNPAPALDVVDLDPTTGDQHWHYTLDATLSGPALAIDSDGSIFVAAGTGSGLHLIHLSSTGALLSDQSTTSARYPSRIILGPTTVTVASQFVNAYAANGFVLEKATLAPPANYAAPCGEPQAVDSTDAIYWSCDGGVQATEADRTPIGAWPGEVSFQIVLGPDGSAYEVPAAYYAANQLMKLH